MHQPVYLQELLPEAEKATRERIPEVGKGPQSAQDTGV